MTIPGTISRGNTVDLRGSNDENKIPTVKTEGTRQSAADTASSDCAAQNSTKTGVSPGNAKQKVSTDSINRREYFRQFLPRLGERLTKGIREINSTEREIQELLNKQD